MPAVMNRRIELFDIATVLADHIAARSPDRKDQLAFAGRFVMASNWNPHCHINQVTNGMIEMNFVVDGANRLHLKERILWPKVP